MKHLNDFLNELNEASKFKVGDTFKINWVDKEDKPKVMNATIQKINKTTITVAPDNAGYIIRVKPNELDKMIVENVNEAKKTTVYVVVEEGDSVGNTAQYVLDDMKVFFNQKDADNYAASQKYGGFVVLREDIT